MIYSHFIYEELNDEKISRIVSQIHDKSVIHIDNHETEQ